MRLAHIVFVDAKSYARRGKTWISVRRAIQIQRQHQRHLHPLHVDSFYCGFKFRHNMGFERRASVMGLVARAPKLRPHHSMHSLEIFPAQPRAVKVTRQRSALLHRGACSSRRVDSPEAPGRQPCDGTRCKANVCRYQRRFSCCFKQLCAIAIHKPRFAVCRPAVCESAKQQSKRRRSICLHAVAFHMRIHQQYAARLRRQSNRP